MKIESDAFVEAAGQPVLEPRYVVGLSLDDDDTEILWLTSHADALSGSFVLGADAGSFSVSGKDAILDHDTETGSSPYTLTARPGAFQVTAWNAQLSFAQDATPTITALAGAFTISGADAKFEHNTETGASPYTLTAREGAFRVTGWSAQLSIGPTTLVTQIDNCVVSISGQTQKISPDKAQHTIGNVTFRILDVDGLFSQVMNSRLNRGEGIREKRIVLYKGHESLTSFDDYSLRLTYIVEGMKYKNGVYLIETTDIQRFEKENIFEIDQAVLNETISASATLIPVIASNAAARFQLVSHDSKYSANPSIDVGYIKIDDEIIAHSGWDAGFNNLIVVQRGALNTAASSHTVTATENDKKKKIDEYIYLEMPAPKMVFALLTGRLLNQTGQSLPDRWHLGIEEKYVRAPDFNGVGVDLYDTVNNTGRVARFMGVDAEDGKKFIEQELLLWMGCFMPIYSDGQIGLKRFQSVVPDAAYDEIIDESGIISYDEMEHDLKSVINNIAISWNWIDSLRRFTKVNQLLDTRSVARHGQTSLKRYAFQGVFTGIHTDADIQNYFRVIRDRYANPPLRLKVKVMPEYDRLEVGDRVRISCSQIIDFNTNSGIDRTFEIQQVQTNWINGEVMLELFGGIEQASDTSPFLTTVLQDSFYNSTGTELSTVLTISGGAVTANGTLTGAASNEDAIYYYEGDLTINPGVTVTITRNVQLRVRGFLVILGTLDLSGGNTADTGYLGITRTGFSAYIYPQLVGKDQDWNYSTLAKYLPSANNVGVPEVPIFTLTNPDGLSVGGMPTNLEGHRGRTGPSGRRSQRFASPPISEVFYAGGAGGAGGAGLLIISRGAAFSGSGKIENIGGDGTEGADPGVGEVYGQTGAGGHPGGVLFLIDGDFSTPFLNASRINAKMGKQNKPALVGDNYLNNAGNTVGGYVRRDALSTERGYGQLVVDNSNKWAACSRIQFIPGPETPFVWLPEDEAGEVANPDPTGVPTGGQPGQVLITDPDTGETVWASTGAYIRLDSAVISGSPSIHEVTWDDTLYNAIRIEIEGIQPATDGVTFRMRVGKDDGATIFDQISDYDGIQLLWEGSPSWSALANNNLIDLAQSASNAANKTLNAVIEIDNTSDPNTGCVIRSLVYYINSVSNMRAIETKAYLDDGNVGAIDTYQLFFASGNFANVGAIRTYGLAK